MSKSGKTHQELFEGLCKVLAENSQPLTEEQIKAISGFIDVLVESVNKNWGATVKEFLGQQKTAMENKSRLALERLAKKFKESKASTTLEDVATMVKTIKEEMGAKSSAECEAVKKEFEEYKKTSVAKVDEAVKAAKTETEVAKQECASMKSKLDASQKTVESAKAKIRQLENLLKEEQLKNYLEGKMSGLPAFEASLMRKRFSGAKSKEEIDADFDIALNSVRERRNLASAAPVNRRDGVLTVQPNQLSENAKVQKKVDLLTETTPLAMSDPDMIDDEFSGIDTDETISPTDMAAWISALG